MNSMKDIKLEKITLNLGAGESGPGLEKSKILLGMFTKNKIMVTKTHKRTTFGGARKKPIGVKVTIRGTEASEILKKLLQSVDNKINVSSFDNSGNFSFGIKEYINIPGIKYNPDIGILGMDVAVTLKRPGFRVRKRKLNPGKIGRKHMITKEESMDFAKKIGIDVSTGEES